MKDRILIIIYVLIITFSSICFCKKNIENDTFFTIATGNYILENGIDEIEPFTIHNNLKFTKLRYGFDVVVASLFNAYGFDGIYCFTIIFCIFISLSLFFICFKVSKSPTISVIMTMIMLLNTQSRYVARAQIISYLVFIWELYFIIQLYKTNKKGYSVAIVFLSFVLLAFHSSVWILFPVLFLPFFAEIIIKKIFFKEQLTGGKRLFLTFIIILLTGIMTPLKFSPYLYPFMSINTVAKEIISELDSSISPLVVAYTIICIVLSLLYKKQRFTFMSVGMLLFSYIANRNIIISILIISIVLADLIGELKNSLIKSKYYLYLYNEALIIFLFFVPYFVYNTYYAGMKNYNSDYYNNSEYPIDAVSYIKNNIDYKNARFYTELNWGSYVEFQGLKAFIDSRTEIFCEEFNESVTVLKDWHYFRKYRNIEVLNRLVDKYSINYIICSTYGEIGDIKLNENGNYYLEMTDSIVDIIKNDSRYSRVYSDDYYSVIKVNNM